jgi:polysaccharide biosynthesis/export protein
MNRRLFAAPAIVLSFAASAAAQDAPPAASASEATAAAVVRAARTVEYVIGPEDVLDIAIWKNPDLSRTVPVRPDGKVSLPLVNDIQAAGLTPNELRNQVTQKLQDYVPQPEVAVIVREVHSVKVAVVGAVRVPGRFEIKTPATVLEMIAMAQGLTEFADRNRISVLRQSATGTQRIPFNYKKVADGSDKDNFFVQPGDIIVVP